MSAAHSVGWRSLVRLPADFDWRSARVRAGLALLPVLAGALAVVPLISLVIIAIGDSGGLWAHLARYVIPVALLQTALLLAGVAVITVTVGAGTAWIMTTFEFPGRSALTWLLPLPLAMPTYIVAYIYADLVDIPGLSIRSLGGAIFVMGFVLYPYVYLAARAMFQTQGAQFAEAGRVLGARPWQLLSSISLPLARPAIAVGLALALLETLNDIGASEYLGVQTLTLSIYATWLNRGSLSGAAQIACVMLVAVAVLVSLERYGRRRRQFATFTHYARVAARVPLSGTAAMLAAAACLVPVLLGFLLPAGYLAREVVVRGLLVGFDPALGWHALTTIGLASIATLTAVAIGFAAVAAARYLRHPLPSTAVSVGGIGYAIPGTVLALGLLSPLVLADEAMNWVGRALGGSGTGLLLAGSAAAVVIAYVVRFLAIAIGFAQAGYARMPTDYDDTARLLGAGPAKIVGSIHLPLARPAIWSAALLIFVDCLKELPATLLLRPLNVETLSTYIYQFATRGSFEEGALAALIIVAAGILPVIHMVRYAELPFGQERQPG
jgi:iron(III) transport system permease protein